MQSVRPLVSDLSASCLRPILNNPTDGDSLAQVCEPGPSGVYVRVALPPASARARYFIFGERTPFFPRHATVGQAHFPELAARVGVRAGVLAATDSSDRSQASSYSSKLGPGEDSFSPRARLPDAARMASISLLAPRDEKTLATKRASPLSLKKQ
mgnify:CR=1 FL=1